MEVTVTTAAIRRTKLQSSHHHQQTNTQCCKGRMPFHALPVTQWYGILGFNVPLDTVYVISETGALSSDVHLPFSNGGPAT